MEKGKYPVNYVFQKNLLCGAQKEKRKEAPKINKTEAIAEADRQAMIRQKPFYVFCKPTGKCAAIPTKDCGTIILHGFVPADLVHTAQPKTPEEYKLSRK